MTKIGNLVHAEIKKIKWIPKHHNITSNRIKKDEILGFKTNSQLCCDLKEMIPATKKSQTKIDKKPL